ncbi:MAG: F0F1 ATP synthase subunit delta [Rhodospirillales bacterium]|nr:F0F1 ATP synthase subunit delta [Rhodospirillales bacterium]
MSSATIGATGLAGRYVSALFELAEAESLLDVVAADLDGLGTLISENADLDNFIRSPVVSRKEQAEGIAALAEKAGFNELTQRFIGVVAANRRLAALPSMIKTYRVLLASRRGETTAEVTSAAALTDKQKKTLGASLKKAVGTKVTVMDKVDPDLIGGMVVKVGSRMVDSSLRTKLQQLRLAMIGVG